MDKDRVPIEAIFFTRKEDGSIASLPDAVRKSILQRFHTKGTLLPEDEIPSEITELGLQVTQLSISIPKQQVERIEIIPGETYKTILLNNHEVPITAIELVLLASLYQQWGREGNNRSITTRTLFQQFTQANNNITNLPLIRYEMRRPLFQALMDKLNKYNKGMISRNEFGVITLTWPPSSIRAQFKPEDAKKNHYFAYRAFANLERNGIFTVEDFKRYEANGFLESLNIPEEFIAIARTACQTFDTG